MYAIRSYYGNNQKKILKTIEMAYRKAPYFDAVFPMLQDILNNEEKNLAKFVGFSIERVANYLGLETKYLFSSQIEKDNTLKAQSKIIHLAGLLNADEYINAIGGQHLYRITSYNVCYTKLLRQTAYMLLYRFSKSIIQYHVF